MNANARRMMVPLMACLFCLEIGPASSAESIAIAVLPPLQAGSNHVTSDQAAADQPTTDPATTADVQQERSSSVSDQRQVENRPNQSEIDAQPESLPKLHVTGTCMGPIPYSTIVVDPPSDVDESKVQQVVDEALDHVNQLMSTYLPDSAVSRFNRNRSTDWIPVDRETVRVVRRALEISELSGGAFDITVGPAVNLWNFGPDKERFQVPSEASIREIKAFVGYQKLEYREQPPALKKLDPRVQIDLSAIAKGYAVDQVATRLSKLGCQNYMVEVGGEVCCHGHRHTGGKWRVGVERPSQQRQGPDIVLELTQRSMATSGDYRNYHRVGKKRYSHTIDPVTCRPVNHFLASACIVTDDCMSADAIATAAMVLGADKAVAFLKRAQVEYVLVQRDSAFGDDYVRTESPGLPVAIKASPRRSKATKPRPAESSSKSILPVFLATAVIFGLVILGMAVGVIFNNKPVTGSCGGLANITNEDGESTCGICSKPTTECVERPANV